MFPGEKHSLYRFLAIYIGSSLLLIAIGSGIFYNYASHRLVDHQFEQLKGDSKPIVADLKRLHRSRDTILEYPVKANLHSALYDLDGNYLIGDFRPARIEWDSEFRRIGDRLYYLQPVSPYYLGVARIVTARPLDPVPIRELQLKMLAFFLAATLFVTIVAFWLGRLFLAPIRRSLRLLDDFIKDTTHELNTPVSTILTNVELFRSFHPELEGNEELARIETASKRLSRIYDDLAYLQLNHRRHRRIEAVDLSGYIEERVHYFRTLAASRRIGLHCEIAESVRLEVDREDIARIFDNFLGNALKYTPAGGTVNVTLTDGCLCVEDDGPGMDGATRNRVWKRFVRADASEGGFGLGLSIVAEIAEYYGFELLFESEKGNGTKAGIRWKN